MTIVYFKRLYAIDQYANSDDVENRAGERHTKVLLSECDLTAFLVRIWGLIVEQIDRGCQEFMLMNIMDPIAHY